MECIAGDLLPAGAAQKTEKKVEGDKKRQYGKEIKMEHGKAKYREGDPGAHPPAPAFIQAQQQIQHYGHGRTMGKAIVRNHPMQLWRKESDAYGCRHSPPDRYLQPVQQAEQENSAQQNGEQQAEMEYCPGIPRNVHHIGTNELDGVGYQRLSVGRNYVLPEWVVHSLVMCTGRIVPGVVLHHGIHFVPIAIRFDDPAVRILKEIGEAQGQQAGHQNQDEEDASGFAGEKRLLDRQLDLAHNSLAYA